MVNLAPNTRIGHIAEGWKIHTRNEVCTCSRQNHYFVRAILGQPIKGVYEFCIVLRGEGEGSAVTVKSGNQDPFASPESI